jgi:uncharacterized membrane protein
MANTADRVGTPTSPYVRAEPSGPSPGMSIPRIASLDVVRGLVMVLMAIDHVRVYSGLPAGGPAPGIFFTRWITHFVAPAFVFLAGTAIYLHRKKVPDVTALSRFLLTRGAWLILLELTVIRVSWTFNFDFAHYMLAGVIWMIGWCMILMAALVHLSVMANAVAGGAIILLHNLLDYAPAFKESLGAGALSAVWKVLYLGGGFELWKGGPPLLVLFVIVPWIGVMMTGYAFGKGMELPASERKSICWKIGLAVTAAFVVLRVVDVYGDPRHWRNVQNAAPALIRFLNTSKYPASLQFLTMTLGPMFLLIAAVQNSRSRVAKVLTTFGRVPFFYYVLHIPLIHLAACIVSLIREGSVNPWLFTNHPLAPGDLPPNYQWSLGLLYLVWVICVFALYFPCRWFANLKARNKSPWLSYL